MAASLEETFARFQTTGDAESLGEVFDRTAPSLLRVAAHFVRDPADAEDLLQSTFLTAIEKAASFDPRRDLRSWLVGILSRHARMHARRERREPDPRRLPPPAEADPARDVERGELLENLEKSLERLPQLYRPVLLLHLKHGLSAFEIAPILTRAPGTVRMQIHRGLELLRHTLPAGLAGGLLPWIFPTRGLAAVRKAVLGNLHRPVLYASASASGSAGILLMKKVLVAACLLLALAMAWFAALPLIGSGHDREDSAPAPALAQAGRAAGPGSAPPALATRSSAARRAAVPQPEGEGSPPPGSLLIAVTFEDRSEPAPAVGVTITPLQVEHTLHAVLRSTDAEGRVALQRVEPGKVLVRLDRGPQAEVLVEPGQQTRVTLAVPSGVDVQGLVLDPDRRPVSGAEIWIYATGSMVLYTNDRGHPVATSDGEGRFRLRSLRSSQWIGARSPFHAPSPLRCVTADAGGGDARVQLELPGPGCSLKGLVLGPEDRPLADALVCVIPARSYPREVPGGGLQQQAVTAFFRSDAQGSFLAKGLAPGATRLAVSAHGHAPRVLDLTLDPAGRPDVTVRLGPGATLSGSVTDRGSRPVPGARVSATRSGDATTAGWAGRHVYERTTRTGPDGRFRLEGLAPGKLRSLVQADGFVPQEQSLAVEGPTGATWDVVLEAMARLKGRVVDVADQGLAGFRVEAHVTAERHGGYFDAVTDALGRFDVAVVPRERYRLQVREPGQWLATPCATLGEVSGGGDEVVIRIADGQRATAWMDATIVDRNGAPVGGAFLQLGDGERILPMSRQRSSFESGSLRAGPVPPRRYKVLLQLPPPLPSLSLGERELRAGQVLELGRIRVAGVGRLAVALKRKDGQRIAELIATLTSESDANQKTALAVGDDGIGSTELMPGSYRLQLYGGPFVGVTRTVAIAEGEETRLELDLEPAVRRTLVFPAPEPQDWNLGKRASYVIRGIDGGEALRGGFALEPETPEKIAPALAAGTYALELQTDAGQRFIGSFRIPDLTPVNDPIRIALAPVR